jgi:hypothetical protein
MNVNRADDRGGVFEYTAPFFGRFQWLTKPDIGA